MNWDAIQPEKLNLITFALLITEAFTIESETAPTKEWFEKAFVDGEVYLESEVVHFQVDQSEDGFHYGSLVLMLKADMKAFSGADLEDFLWEMEMNEEEIEDEGDMALSIYDGNWGESTNDVYNDGLADFLKQHRGVQSVEMEFHDSPYAAKTREAALALAQQELLKMGIGVTA